jgi:hypothetical protein
MKTQDLYLQAVQQIKRGTPECVIWEGPVTREGYPRWRNQKLHRVMYRDFVGAVPAMRPLVRDCGELLCVNPAHMRVSDRKSGGHHWPSAVERFESRIRVGQAFRDLGSCWLWDVPDPNTGYGTIYDGARNVLAHRWSYEHHVAEIPDGMQIDHLCRNRICVNPAHLEPVTIQVNGERGRLARQGQDWIPGVAS